VAISGSEAARVALISIGMFLFYSIDRRPDSTSIRMQPVSAGDALVPVEKLVEFLQYSTNRDIE
jgi:hypothetical protein